MGFKCVICKKRILWVFESNILRMCALCYHRVDKQLWCWNILFILNHGRLCSYHINKRNGTKRTYMQRNDYNDDLRKIYPNVYKFKRMRTPATEKHRISQYSNQ